MCYAFRDVVKANVELVREEIHRREDVGPFPYPVAEPKSQKRSAVIDIEERPAKVAKCSIDLVFESSAEAEELSAQEAVEQQKKDLRDELAKSKTQVSNLKEEVQDLKEQNGDLLDELFVFRAAQEQQGQKAKAGSSDGKDLKKLAVKKAREAWKAEENKRVGKLKTTCQKNIDDARERFEKRIELRDEKHEDLIAAKDQACKKKVRLRCKIPHGLSHQNFASSSCANNTMSSRLLRLREIGQVAIADTFTSNYRSRSTRPRIFNWTKRRKIPNKNLLS